MIVVADSGPIIHLSRLGRIDLLPSLYGRILVPAAVRREVVERGRGLAGSAELAAADWADSAGHDPESEPFRSLHARLDEGEAAALALAVERRADLLLSDDRQARSAAVGLGLAVRGTLGILSEARRGGQVAALAPLLSRLQTEGIWLSEALVARVLEEHGESGA